MAKAVLLSLGEFRRRLGRVLPWSQLERDNVIIYSTAIYTYTMIWKHFLNHDKKSDTIFSVVKIKWGNA